MKSILERQKQESAKDYVLRVLIHCQYRTCSRGKTYRSGNMRSAWREQDTIPGSGIGACTEEAD